MFEDFRKQMDDSSFPGDKHPASLFVDDPQPEGRFLGMTPVQRFIVAVLLLMMTVTLGALFLLVTSKIVPPFLGGP